MGKCGCCTSCKCDRLINSFTLKIDHKGDTYTYVQPINKRAKDLFNNENSEYSYRAFPSGTPITKTYTVSAHVFNKMIKLKPGEISILNPNSPPYVDDIGCDRCVEYLDHSEDYDVVKTDEFTINPLAMFLINVTLESVDIELLYNCDGWYNVRITENISITGTTGGGTSVGRTGYYASGGQCYNSKTTHTYTYTQNTINKGIVSEFKLSCHKELNKTNYYREYIMAPINIHRLNYSKIYTENELSYYGSNLAPQEFYTQKTEQVPHGIIMIDIPSTTFDELFSDSYTQYLEEESIQCDLYRRFHRVVYDSDAALGDSVNFNFSIDFATFNENVNKDIASVYINVPVGGDNVFYHEMRKNPVHHPVMSNGYELTNNYTQYGVELNKVFGGTGIFHPHSLTNDFINKLKEDPEILISGSGGEVLVTPYNNQQYKVGNVPSSCCGTGIQVCTKQLKYLGYAYSTIGYNIMIRSEKAESENRTKLNIDSIINRSGDVINGCNTFHPVTMEDYNNTYNYSIGSFLKSYTKYDGYFVNRYQLIQEMSNEYVYNTNIQIPLAGRDVSYLDTPIPLSEFGGDTITIRINK